MTQANYRTPSQKKNRKKSRNAAISILLIIALIVGIFAFLSATDTKTNVFTVGKVNIALREDDWYDENDHIKDDNNGNGVPDFAENVLPGEKVPKAPYVENTGSSPANIYLAVGMPIADWDEIYTGDGTYNGPAFPDIIIKTFGIQENYAQETDGEKIWNAYVNNTGLASLLGEPAQDAYNKIQIFETIGLNSTDWTPMSVRSSYDPSATDITLSNVYQSADGHNYYLYKYNNANGTAVLDSHAVTPELFTHVQLFKEIGDNKEEPPRPYAVNYYVQRDNTTSNINNTSGTIAAASLGTAKTVSTSNIENLDNKDNWVLQATEMHQGNYTIDTFAVNNAYSPNASLFDWMVGSIDGDHVSISDTAAYSGMEIYGETNLFAVNTDYTDGLPAASYLQYSIADNSGATLYGACLIAPDLPTSPTTVVVPSTLVFTKVNDEYVLQNGYLFNTVGNGFQYAYRQTLTSSELRFMQSFKVSDTEYRVPVSKVYVEARSNERSNEPGVFNSPSNYPATTLVSIARKLALPNCITDLTYVGNYLGNTNYSVLEEINIPYECRNLGTVNGGQVNNESVSSGLYNNTRLTEVVLPNNLKRIAYRSFAKTGITDLTLPNSVEAIGPYAFGYGNIASLTVPHSLSEAYANSFCGVDTLIIDDIDTVDFVLNKTASSSCKLGCQTLRVNSTLNEFKAKNLCSLLKIRDAFPNTVVFKDTTLTADTQTHCSTCGMNYWTALGCACSAGDAYYSNNTLMWVNPSITTLNIREGTTYIPEYLLDSYTNLTSVTIPDSIQEIGARAFARCTFTINISWDTYMRLGGGNGNMLALFHGDLNFI